MNNMDAERLRWQRRDDARTLAEAERIKADKNRYAGAIIGAREIASEEIERVKGIAKIAGMKTPQAPKEADIEPAPFRGRQNPARVGKF